MSNMNKQTKIALTATLSLIFLMLGCYAAYFQYAWQTDDDFRLGCKLLLNDVGFGFDLDEERKPKPPKIGSRQNEVENYCGAPNDRHSYQRSGVTIVTINYIKTTHYECKATFTFVNGELDSISK